MPLPLGIATGSSNFFSGLLNSTGCFFIRPNEVINPLDGITSLRILLEKSFGCAIWFGSRESNISRVKIPLSARRIYEQSMEAACTSTFISRKRVFVKYWTETSQYNTRHPPSSILLIQGFLDLQYYDIVDCMDNVAKRLWKEGSSADGVVHEKQKRHRRGSWQ